MPPVKGSKWDKKLKRFVSSGSSSETASSLPEPVREPIKQVLGAGGDEEDFMASLPSSTVTETPQGEVIPPTRKKRTPKDAPTESDPLMSDPRYKTAVTNMSGLGGAKVIKVGFRATGKPLDAAEETEIDDLFYVMGKRSNLDPGSSWWILGLYAFFLLCRLIVMRTEAGTLLAGIFDKPTKSDEVEEATKQ